MVRLKRIPAVRAANMLTLTIAIPYGIILALAALFVFPAYVTVNGAPQQSSTSLLPQLLAGWFGSWAITILTIWLFVAIVCGLYNLIAGRFGGIELEFTTIPPIS